MPLQQFSLVTDREPAVPSGGGRWHRDADGAPRLSVDRDAPTLLDAIADAIAETEFAGVTVVRVDGRDWVTLADVAGRIGRSREIVRLWAAGRRGPGGFPPPLNPGMETAYYSWAAVGPWLRQRLGYPLADEGPVFDAVNLALRLRALAPRIGHMHLIRALLRA
jgi:hypothetical protein